MFREEIDYFHAPQVSLEVLFAVWSEKVTQRRRGGGPLRNGPQKLGCRLGDAVIARHRFAESRWLSSRPSRLFIAGEFQRANDFMNPLPVVRCINSQRIADF